jgi:hypothetical protein
MNNNDMKKELFFDMYINGKTNINLIEVDRSIFTEWEIVEFERLLDERKI